MVRWRSERRSSNVEDRRGMRSRMGMPLKLGGGIGGIVILLLVLVMGGDPSSLLNVATEGGGVGPPTPRGDARNDEALEFASRILGSTEDEWSAIFTRNGATYREPTLVVYEEAVRSACGSYSSATGPFYCPADQSLYLDPSFFRQLAQMGGAGDFAAAYVIGHEVGHHVQQIAGVSDRVRRLQSQARSQSEANSLQVLMELQADCFAGVWAHHANRKRSILEPGDVEEGLAAAAAIGDDRLQERAGRRVRPESFTHGSSAERQAWLRTGLETGDPDACDTLERAGV